MLRLIPQLFKSHAATTLVVVTGISIGTIVKIDLLKNPDPVFVCSKK